MSVSEPEDNPDAVYHSAIRPDPVLGWRGRPNFSGRELMHPQSWIDLDERGWRKFNKRERPGAPKLNLYGCSFTFGCGVLEDEFFGARLSAELEAAEISVRAFGGYGTIQSFRLLQRDLRRPERCDVAVFCMLDIHVCRNAAIPQFIQEYCNFLSDSGEADQFRGFFPEAKLDSLGQLRLSMRAAPPPAALEWHDHFRVDMHYQNLVTARLLEAAKAEAERFGSRFAVALLLKKTHPDDTEALMNMAREMDITVFDVSAALTDEVLLHDGHPDARGHAAYADALGSELTSFLA